MIRYIVMQQLNIYLMCNDLVIYMSELKIYSLILSNNN